ncbi:hypothetical protein [Oceaniglobus trochenteri]|uniref:hypothetical protein n=1 Tax=Oceaniglobus trochenteri TaxID=2763260 RepID=UPI001CFF89F8|nr:hypothetical protein [Oceaniglobus trochenteri]
MTKSKKPTEKDKAAEAEAAAEKPQEAVPEAAEDKPQEAVPEAAEDKPQEAVPEAASEISLAKAAGPDEVLVQFVTDYTVDDERRGTAREERYRRDQTVVVSEASARHFEARGAAVRL